jgi:hypothetical protein
MDMIKSFERRIKLLTSILEDEIKKDDVQTGFPTWAEINDLKLPEKPGVGKATWCNRFAIRVLARLGYDVNDVLAPNPYTNKPDLGWTSANSIVRLAKKNVWRVPERMAQGLANIGIGVLIGAEGTNKSGHVGIVAPRKWNKMMGVYVCQAGGFVGYYFRKDKRSFNVEGIEEPNYFILRRDRNVRKAQGFMRKAYIC